MNADQALDMLTRGNNRYVTENYSNIYIGVEKREELAEEGQHPFAVIVSCSDSRVPPEIIFDQGLGALFVVRTAGEIVDDIGLGSVEYAVEHLGVKLIVVLGHQDCGAVKAAVEDSNEPGHISLIVEAIKPAVEIAKTQYGDLLNNAIKENVNLNIYRIKKSRLIWDSLLYDDLEIIGAVYDIYDGHVHFWC